MLTNNEHNKFEEQGWIGSYPLMDKLQVRELTEKYLNSKDNFISPKNYKSNIGYESFKEKTWFKGVHSVIPEFYDIVTHPRIVSKIKKILGDNIILWGTAVTIRPPGKSHRWHIDIEHKEWKGVSVFIGLKGTSNKATLKIITTSHNIDSTNAQFHKNPTDQDILNQCTKENSKAKLINVDIEEGNFFIFDGTLWHGSDNVGNDTRHAIIAQYTTPENLIRVPLTFNNPIKWSNYSPPCILVSGKDEYSLNKLIERPYD